MVKQLREHETDEQRETQGGQRQTGQTSKICLKVEKHKN